MPRPGLLMEGGGPGLPGLRLGVRRGRVLEELRVENVGDRERDGRLGVGTGWGRADSQVGEISQAPLG